MASTFRYLGARSLRPAHRAGLPTIGSVRLLSLPKWSNAPDLYELLGVARTASPEEIKAAYFKLAKQYHPDRVANDPTAADRFAEISRAYKIFTEPLAKQYYDVYVDKVAVGDRSRIEHWKRMQSNRSADAQSARGYHSRAASHAQAVNQATSTPTNGKQSAATVSGPTANAEAQPAKKPRQVSSRMLFTERYIMANLLISKYNDITNPHNLPCLETVAVSMQTRRLPNTNNAPLIAMLALLTGEAPKPVQETKVKYMNKFKRNLRGVYVQLGTRNKAIFWDNLINVTIPRYQYFAGFKHTNPKDPVMFGFGVREMMSFPQLALSPKFLNYYYAYFQLHQGKFTLSVNCSFNSRTPAQKRSLLNMYRIPVVG